MGSVLFIFLVVLCYVPLSFVLCCPLRFPHKNDVRFVFTSSCLQEGSCVVYGMCVCLRIMVSNTYCVVFLFCFSSSCVPYVDSFSSSCVPYVDSFSSSCVPYVDSFSSSCVPDVASFSGLPLLYSLTFIFYTNILIMSR